MSLFWQNSNFIIDVLFSVCVYGDSSSTCLNYGLLVERKLNSNQKGNSKCNYP